MTAAPEAGKRAAPCRPDWRSAARLLALGEGVASVARTLGCSRSQLSRKRIQAWIREFQRMGPHERMVQLSEAVHRAIEVEVGKPNVRVVLWLADRLKLVTPPSERTPGEELRDLLSGLTPEELHEFESLRQPVQQAPPAEDPPSGEGMAAPGDTPVATEAPPGE